ncbi:Protein of unknown function [Methylobacillus rhizosphaerae]|uniref:DUF2490 domain-containing protein n=1 Tax=Methylobacillus rhizosphaerae TaxID=551994 RepID=A0A238YSU2_9PROT|nr:DUF2490 domain-containing protein [Methylobacillus rhizosphaerae]SNR74346.1 Protein of unknown function [Methylobacillus rhizosphaerae]
MYTVLRPFCGLMAMALLMTGQNAAADTEIDGGYWFNLHLQGRLPIKHFFWSMDTNPRWREEGRHLDQLYLRPSVFYALNPKTSLWLGHDTIVRHPAGKSTLNEYRVWEQFKYHFDPVSTVTFTNRTRLEQRRREGYHDTGHRLRQMIKATAPLSIDPKLSLVVSDELFINMNNTDWGTYRGIDQNRLFLGFNWKLDESSNIEAGYLNQFINTRTTNRDNHILTTTLGFKF